MMEGMCYMSLPDVMNKGSGLAFCLLEAASDCSHIKKGKTQDLTPLIFCLVHMHRMVLQPDSLL